MRATDWRTIDVLAISAFSAVKPRLAVLFRRVAACRLRSSLPFARPPKIFVGLELAMALSFLGVSERRSSVRLVSLDIGQHSGEPVHRCETSVLFGPRVLQAVAPSMRDKRRGMYLRIETFCVSVSLIVEHARIARVPRA